MRHNYAIQKSPFGSYQYVCKNCGLSQVAVITKGLLECSGKKKKTIAKHIYEKIKPKPATKEEIAQLKLDYEKARLKAGIRAFKQGSKPKTVFTSNKTRTKLKASRTKDIDLLPKEKQDTRKYDALLKSRRINFW